MNTTPVEIKIWVDNKNIVNYEAKTATETIATGKTKNTLGFVARINRQLKNSVIVHNGWGHFDGTQIIMYGETI